MQLRLPFDLQPLSYFAIVRKPFTFPTNAISSTPFEKLSGWTKPPFDFSLEDEGEEKNRNE
jgi:hypothetical protein